MSAFFMFTFILLDLYNVYYFVYYLGRRFMPNNKDDQEKPQSQNIT